MQFDHGTYLRIEKNSPWPNNAPTSQYECTTPLQVKSKYFGE